MEYPAQAIPHLPVLVSESKRLHSPIPAYIMAGQIDHETACPIPRKCWNPGVQFATAREQGAGLGQITRVFGRFDALAEMRAANMRELSEWSWENVNTPIFQIRALVLKNRQNHAAVAGYFADPLKPVLTAYNAGIGGIRADRRLCQVTKGCDASKWAGNVAVTCSSSKKLIPGTRYNACQIKGKYADDVIARAQKYRKVAP